MFEKIKGKLKGFKSIKESTKESIGNFKSDYDESRRQRGLALYGQKYQDYLDMKEKSNERKRKKNAVSLSKKVDVNGKRKQGK
jgi:hypothetical protein